MAPPLVLKQLHPCCVIPGHCAQPQLGLVHDEPCPLPHKSYTDEQHAKHLYVETCEQCVRRRMVPT